MTDPPAAPPSGLDALTEHEVGDLQQFLLYLGSALTAAGEAVNEIQDHLAQVARVYGAPDARFSVLPTGIAVALDPRRPATLEPTRQLRGGLRLDQTSALFAVLKAAERGELRPDDGVRRIHEIVESSPRFRSSLGWVDADVRSMVAPLVTFLPRRGAHHGRRRAVGRRDGHRRQPPGRRDAATAPAQLRDRGSLGWLCLVLYVGWIGQYVGSELFGAYLSGFFGALVMTPVAYLVSRRPTGPPALVSFLPAFWLLVPAPSG